MRRRAPTQPSRNLREGPLHTFVGRLTQAPWRFVAKGVDGSTGRAVHCVTVNRRKPRRSHMTQSKVPFLLFGAAAGVAIGAALIGLLLVGIAVAVDFNADTASVLTQHPLFISGSSLISTGLFAGLPLFTIYYRWRKQGRLPER